MDPLRCLVDTDADPNTLRGRSSKSVRSHLSRPLTISDGLVNGGDPWVVIESSLRTVIDQVVDHIEDAFPRGVAVKTSSTSATSTDRGMPARYRGIDDATVTCRRTFGGRTPPGHQQVQH
jgi:hypothetical protein